MAARKRKREAVFVDELAGEADAQVALRAQLEHTIARKIRDAIDSRASSGIEEVWAEDEDQYNGVDAVNAPTGVVKTRDQAPRRTKSGGRSTVYLNITQPKTQTAVARVQEMLVPHDERPFAVTRQPIPDIDELIAAQSQVPVRLGDGTMVPAAVAGEAMNAKADKLAEKKETWIDDKFVEGSVYGEMRKVIRSAGRYGTGCLKGPFPVMRTRKKWSVADGIGRLDVMQSIEPTSRCIRIQDCFPSPDCGECIHDGSYFVERDYLTLRKLADLAALPDYDQGAIAVAMEEGPRVIGGNNDLRRDNAGDTFNEAELFEVYYVYTHLAPEDLVLLGLDNGMPEGESRLDENERVGPPMAAIATMVNGRCIKCTVNPLETGDFPYDFFLWDVVDGQPWGRGIPHKMGVAQRGLNAAVRKQLENAGLSGGPQIIFTRGAVEPMDTKWEITGRKLWAFNPTDAIGDITKAFAVFNIPSMQEQLGAIIQFWLEMADVLTNMPLMMHGMLKEGATPETLGGMRLMMSNMTSPLRVIAKQYDDQLIVPHLNRWNTWYMQDPNVPIELKDDSTIKARGASALVQRAEDGDFLVMLWASKGDPDLKLDPAKLVREIAKARGFSMNTVQYTEDEWKRKQAEMAQQQPPADPRIQAAQIRNEGIQIESQARAEQAQAEREFKAQQAAEDRASAEVLRAAELDLQAMELAGKQQISLSQVKAMLAGKAMDNRLATDEMRLKLTPRNRSGLGI